MTTLTMINQACVLIEHGDIRLLSDPWLNEPVWIGAAISIPHLNEEERTRALELIDSATHIYLSHDHEDHWDPALLRSLKPKTILVGNFNSTRFRRTLKELESIHTILYFNHLEDYEINATISLRFYLEQPEYRTNSMALVRTPEGYILNGNDCGLDTDIFENVKKEVAKNTGPLIFLYTINFLAGGYPFPYLRQSNPDYKERVLKLKENLLSKTKEAIEFLDADYTIMYAGPNYLIDPVNKYFSDFPEAQDWTKMVAALNESCLTIWPAIFSSFSLSRSNGLQEIEVTNWDKYLSREIETEKFLASDPWEMVISRDSVLENATSFAAEIGKLQKEMEMPISQELVFSIVPSLKELEDEAEFHISVTYDEEFNPHVQEITGLVNPSGSYHQVISNACILNSFFLDEITWNLFYGGRIRMTRKPESFNQNLHFIMTFCRDKMARLALKKWYRSTREEFHNETMEIVLDGKKYEMLRLCPHEGQDLSFGEIADGILSCPRHKWKFDVKTGKCVEGDLNTSICSRLLEESSLEDDESF